MRTGPEDISVYNLDPQIVARYNSFINSMKGYAQSGMNVDQIGASLQPSFGDTYWWDYCVLREIKSY